MNKDKRHQIFSRLRDDNPKPTTELNFNSTFELLIAVILYYLHKPQTKVSTKRQQNSTQLPTRPKPFTN